MRIKKAFQMTLSHKFPNGDIASVQLGTTEEVDSLLDSASEEVIADFSDDLADKVFKATMSDLKRIVKGQPLIREVWMGMKDAVKSQKNEREVAALLDED